MRITVKVGSQVLTRPDGTLDEGRMAAITDQIAALRAQGHEIILVSSGAVACGRGRLSPTFRMDPVEQRQLFSAVGQVRLIGVYDRLLAERGITVGQVLTMKESFSTRREYLNQRGCVEVMLRAGVLPVVNENDTVSVTELMFTDNDELSGLVASMTRSDLLIILSNVDGVYDGNPSDKDARLLEKIRPEDNLGGICTAGKSHFGRGGMQTKVNFARRQAAEGRRVIIARGSRDNVLTDLLERPAEVPHTEFEPASGGVSGIRRWLAHSEGFAKGRLHVNAQAVKVLRGARAASLLPVGVTQAEGDFEEGDIVDILDPQGRVIALGRAACGAAAARAVLGRHDEKPLVHYDYLYLL